MPISGFVATDTFYFHSIPNYDGRSTDESTEDKLTLIKAICWICWVSQWRRWRSPYES